MPEAKKATDEVAVATPVTAIPYEHYRRQRVGAAQTEAAGLKMDETEPGGRYRLPDGTEVDADGHRLKGRDRGELVAGTRGTHADMAAGPPVAVEGA